jgi:hypothetical protein
MDSNQELTILTRRIQLLLPIVTILIPDNEVKAKFKKVADEILRLKQTTNIKCQENLSFMKTKLL